MRIIRAAEINTYCFCKRAWWYQIQGFEPENQAELAWGREIHEKHSRDVIYSKYLQGFAYLLISLAIISVIIWFIQSKF